MKATTRKRLSEGKQFALQQVHAIRGRANEARLDALEQELTGASTCPTADSAKRGGAELEPLRVVEDEDALLLHLRFDAIPADKREGAGAARTENADAAQTVIDGIEWRCLNAAGDPVPCEARVIARDTGMSELCVSLRIPKRAESLLLAAYAHGAVAATRPLATMAIDEGILWQALRSNRELVASARDDCCYPRWFAAHRTTQDVLDAQRLTSLPDEPIFSIVVPLFRTPPAFFRDMLESVRTQTYPYWQLVLVNASPEDDALARAVAQAAAAEPRITVVPLDENLGITLNTNAGIGASIGDFVAFFDHDDVLEPDLLFEYARAINERPDTDMLYCDEDNLLPNGDLMHPFFKPDFQPDLLRRRNYLCHLLAVRKELLDALEPAGVSFDGSQDHNCALRISETARRVTHVPKLLYHWRVNPESVAGNPDAKDYCNEAGILAVSEHLSRIGAKGAVGRAGLPFRYRIRYDVPEEPCVSLIIPCLAENACDTDATGAEGACGAGATGASAVGTSATEADGAGETNTSRTAGAAGAAGIAAEASTVGNGHPKHAEYAEAHPDASASTRSRARALIGGSHSVREILTPLPPSYDGMGSEGDVPIVCGISCRGAKRCGMNAAAAAATASSATTRYLHLCNDAARTATGAYLLFASPGTADASPEWVETMLGFCLQPDVAAVGAKTIYPDGTVKHAGLAFVRKYDAGATDEDAGEKAATDEGPTTKASTAASAGDARASSEMPSEPRACNADIETALEDADRTGGPAEADAAPAHIVRLDFAASAFQGSYFDLADDPQNVDAVSAECLMTRRADFLELGGFDESLPFDLASADYCLRLRRAGKRIVYAPDAIVTQVGLRIPDAAGEAVQAEAAGIAGAPDTADTAGATGSTPETTGPGATSHAPDAISNATEASPTGTQTESAENRFNREWGAFIAGAPRTLNPNLSQDSVFGPYRHLGKA